MTISDAVPVQTSPWILRLRVGLCLLFLLIGSQRVLGATGDLAGAKALPGCSSVSVVELQAEIGNLVTPEKIAQATTGWHSYDLRAEDPAAKALPNDQCAVVGEVPEDAELASGREVARDWLRWDTFAFAWLYPALLAWLVARSTITWKIGRAVGLALCVVIVLSDWWENWLLGGQINKAWASANENGTAKADLLDSTWLNVAGCVKWATAVLVAAGLCVHAIRHASSFLGGVRIVLRSVGLRWVPATAVVVFFIAVTRVAQLVDAVRRWGPEQAVLTVGLTLGFGAMVAITAAGALRPATPATSTVTQKTHAGDFYGARQGLVLLLGTGIALAVLATVLGWRGLYVPATIFSIASVTSMLSRPVVDAPRSRSERESPHIDDWRKLGGWLGALAVLGLALAMVAAASSDLFLRPGSGSRIALLVIGLVLCALIPLLAGVFTHIAQEVADLEKQGSRRVLVALAALSGASASALMFDASALKLAPDIGAIAVLLVFLCCVCVIAAAGEWLTEWFNLGEVRYDFGLPPVMRQLGVERAPIGGLMVVWLLAAGFVDPGGYHNVRTIALESGVPERTMDEAVIDWVGRLPEGEQPQLMLIVGASGGGIRAAYWTAAVLDCVVERDTYRGDPCGQAADAGVAGRRSGLFLMSGVSGGSLGLVEYTAAVATTGSDGDNGWTDDVTKAVERSWYRDRLDEDFLAPATVGLLFDDLVQGFLRDDEGTDRAELLERSWEDQWHAGELGAGFFDSQRSENQQPVLLLNGYSVEDGCRFAVTVLVTNGNRSAQQCDVPVLFDENKKEPGPGTLLNGTTDLADLLCTHNTTEDQPRQDVALSTAALLSARFPYISPSGRLQATPCDDRDGGDLTYVVDGGYRETSAGSPVVELLPELERSLLANRGDRCIVPFYVQIDNGYASSPTGKPDSSPEESLVPPMAINANRNGQNAVARTATYRAFSEPIEFRSVADPKVPLHPMVTARSDAGVATDQQRSLVITTRAHPGAEAPLGWVLSPSSQDDLDNQLRVNRAQIEYLRSLLDGDGLRCE